MSPSSSPRSRRPASSATSRSNASTPASPRARSTGRTSRSTPSWRASTRRRRSHDRPSDQAPGPGGGGGAEPLPPGQGGVGAGPRALDEAQPGHDQGGRRDPEGQLDAEFRGGGASGLDEGAEPAGRAPHPGRAYVVPYPPGRAVREGRGGLRRLGEPPAPAAGRFQGIHL